MVSRGVKSSSSVSASYGKKQGLFSARSGCVLTEDVDGVVAADKREKLSAECPLLFTSVHTGSPVPQSAAPAVAAFNAFMSSPGSLPLVPLPLYGLSDRKE